MFHEEKIIGGVLHYRSMPDALWAPYTLDQLTRRYMAAQLRESRLYQQNAELKAQLDDANLRIAELSEGP